MSCSYVLNENYLDPNIYASLTKSSELLNFPATNTLDKTRRTKVWRTSGHWLIDSTNKTIVFRDTVATINLEAVLTEGDYSSDTAFFAEIKTQMEAVGGSVYTISRDTTINKIKITSDGSGGDGTFVLRFNDILSDGFCDLTGYDKTFHTGALTYTSESLKIHSSEWLKFDLAIPSTPKAFIMTGFRNKPIQISPTATIKLQGNETDAWDSPSFETTLSYDSRVIYEINDNDLHTSELRYWRVYLEDTDNPNGYIEISNIYLGDYIKTSRGAVQFPFLGKHEDRSRTIFSEGGQSFSDVRQKYESFSLQWAGLTIAEKETFESMYDEYGVSYPFFVSIDTPANISSASNYYIRYVKLSNPIEYSLLSPNNYQVTMRLREEL